MPAKQQFVNSLSFNLGSALTAIATVLVPPSYSGWPTSGQFVLKCEAEIIWVTVTAGPTWTMARGQEGTTPASHVLGAYVSSPLTEGALDHIVGVSQAGVLESVTRDLNILGARVTDVAGVATLTIADGLVQVLVDGASIPWDLALGSGSVTLGGNRALANPTNLVPGRYSLLVIQDATGTRLLTYGSVYKFPAGTAPTLSVAGSAVDLLEFLSDGTHLYLASFAAALA